MNQVNMLQIYEKYNENTVCGEKGGKSIVSEMS